MQQLLQLVSYTRFPPPCLPPQALVLPSGDIWTMNEDQIIRVYRTGALAQTIPMPGVAWYAAPLSNGDVAVVCNQAGRSLLGHAYVFSVDPARTGDAALEAQFEEDMKAAATTGQSDGGTGGGESEQVPIAGPYEQRQSLPGTKEGQISIFLRADGVQMVCAWSSSSGSWTDIGVRQEGPGAGGAGPSAALESVAAPSAGGSSTPLQPGEIRRSVTMETPTGLRTLNLQFHASGTPHRSNVDGPPFPLLAPPTAKHVSAWSAYALGVAQHDV